MAVRQLRFKNDEALRKKGREVTEVNDKIRMLLDDMMVRCMQAIMEPHWRQTR